METKLKKDDLVSIKSDIDKLDIDKLERVSKWFKQFEKWSR